MAVRSLVLPIAFLVSLTGCTSHSWTKITRQYVVPYRQVFDEMPEHAKKCTMAVKKSDPEAGLIELRAHRVVDKILTGSLFNWFAGDVVIVKVTRVDPTTTEVFIDSKARGQIGPDLGRTDRNVTTLAGVLDQVWPRADQLEEERGGKRPGASPEESEPEASTEAAGKT